MAEKDDILEETEDAGDDVEQAKKGLSTALLIKVAIGLAVLLIVLAVALFFFTSTETDNPDENTEVTQTEQTDGNEELVDNDSASAAAKDNATTDTGNDAMMNASTAEKALAQILELQQQLTELKAENQELNTRIEELTTENNDLKKQGDTLSQKKTDSELPLDQLINTPDLPRDYRRDDYANSPKFELEPKWGEFETSTKTK